MSIDSKLDKLIERIDYLEKLITSEHEQSKDKLLSKNSLREYFDNKLSIGKIHGLVKTGKLIPVYLGRSVFYRLSDVQKLLSNYN